MVSNIPVLTFFPVRNEGIFSYFGYKILSEILGKATNWSEILGKATYL